METEPTETPQFSLVGRSNGVEHSITEARLLHP